ncbi:hypothetical protein CBR_g49461 [Chara braunii]|uniref:non-specific serine/threonine protein kinase n=1 Tax=Chara braunii TaxID=69332 RepID=A0A388K4X1_CHABU|nr:hypothetical protein CBR_g49461 [Chara braunii]|eukprot:GBG65097.1 hypothetical protein CBR_g49461 [Chara braunii]
MDAGHVMLGKVQYSFRAPRLAVTAHDFAFGRLLGLGSYSKVVEATMKSTGEKYALKVMDKQHILKERKGQYIKRERLILDQLDHPGVVKLCFTFQDEHSLSKKICVLMEGFLAFGTRAWFPE